MKVKKYPQSHLVVTSDSGKKLIIDPGYLTFDKGFKVSDFQEADVYLITHQHADHLGPETIKEVVGETEVFGNADVVAKLAEVGVKATEVKNGQEFEAGGFKITPYDLPHFQVPGKQMPLNTGFVVDGVLFHAGDGTQLSGPKVTVAALPLGTPVTSTLSVLEFAKSLDAKILIPIHYDVYIRDPEELKKLSEYFGIEIRPLGNGEETEV